MINEFNRPNLETLRQDLNAALATIAANHGIDLRVGSCRFSSNVATLKVEASVKGGEGEQFKAKAILFGLPPHAFNKTVTIAGGRYKIVGIAPKSFKFPIIGVKESDGKRYKLPVELVRSALF